jgi:hypothetical protein
MQVKPWRRQAWWGEDWGIWALRLLLKGEEYGLACGLSLAVTAGWQKPLPVDRHGPAPAARHGAMAAAAHSSSATRGTPPPLHTGILLLHTSRSSLPAVSLSLPLRPTEQGPICSWISTTIMHHALHRIWIPCRHLRAHVIMCLCNGNFVRHCMSFFS